MGSYSRTYSFTDGTTAYGSQVAFELDALGTSVNNIVNAQISVGAAIADSKLAQLTTGSKVALSALVQGSTATQILSAGAGTGAWAEYTTIFLTPKEYTDVAVTDTSDRTTTSSTYADVTGVTSTFTVGKQGLVHCHFSGRGDSSSGIDYYALDVDGTTVQEVAIPSGVAGNPVSFSYSAVLAAGSHTVKLRHKNTDNSSVMTLKGTVVNSRLRISYPT